MFSAVGRTLRQLSRGELRRFNALLVGLAKTNLSLDVTLNTAVGAHSVVGQLRQARFEGRHHIMSFAYGCAGIQHDGLGDAQVVHQGSTVVLRIRDMLGEQVASISPSDEVAGRLMWQRLDFSK